MNAFEKATNLRMISRITTVIHLFKSQFPEAKEDLNPWMTNPETEKFADPDSIDLSFHFPRYSTSCQSRSILMQIRLRENDETEEQQVLGIELSGYDYQGQQWQFSTIGYWQFLGQSPPLPDAGNQLKQVCFQILKLFNYSGNDLEADSSQC